MKRVKRAATSLAIVVVVQLGGGGAGGGALALAAEPRPTLFQPPAPAPATSQAPPPPAPPTNGSEPPPPPPPVTIGDPVPGATTALPPKQTSADANDAAAPIVRTPGKVGLRYTLEGVEVRGNTTTLARVVLRYVQFRAGDTLDVDDS